RLSLSRQRSVNSALRFSRRVTKFLQKIAQLSRQHRANFDPCTGPRLREAELCGVQKITPQLRQCELAKAQFPCRTVKRIAHHGMLQRREVHSNLMRAPGMEPDFHQRRVA